MSRCGLSVERRLTPRDPTLALSGQLDAAAVGIARRLLAREIDAVDGDVNLELSGLDFIGFGGLDVLIELSHRMAVDDRRLRIVGTSPMVDRMLEIGRIDLDAPDDTGGYVLPSPPTSGVPGGCGRHTRSGLDIRPLTPRPIARTDRMPADFTIAITDASSGGVQIAVTGELDVVTTPALRDALNEAAARGGAVALDLAEVTFIDSTALGALLEARRRLEATGGLYMSHRSPVVSRLLQLAGLANHFANEPAARSEAAVDDPIQQRLHGIISELAGVLLTATSLRDDLEQLIGFSCQALPRCSAASVALLVDGEPTTVAVSDHLALELDGVQYDKDEGPCLAALDGQRVRVDLVDADERFPHFAVGATDRRVHSVLSMPILHDHDVVGTLNFYSRDTDAFDETADHIARLASSQAANAIARSDVLTATRQRRDQLRAHYEEAAVAARAQGVLMATQSCSAEQARNLLHHAAATTGDSLLTIAQRILDSARNPPTA